MNVFHLVTLLGICQFTYQSVDTLFITVYHRELGRCSQTSNSVTFAKNITISGLDFCQLLLYMPSPTTSSGWESDFPCRIPVAGGERRIFSPLHAPLPLLHSKACADVATCPHEYPSFVHWKAQILCKELLLYHLAICEFFSSRDVCEKAETQRPESKPFTSNSSEKREKDPNQFTFTNILSFKVLM